MGILVGYVIKILLYNLNEVIDVMIVLIDNLNIINDEILKYIKGLDFLIGGIV